MNSSINKLTIAALGGVNEIGKNMYMLQYDDDIIAIDCGSKFPDESFLGIDLIVPDVTYLLANKDKVRALVVTHGHEDHIGGIPYLLKQLNIPVYATKLTIGLIEVKLKEHGILNEARLNIIDAQSRLDLGSIQASFFSTNHSIPDCLGIAFHTPEGTMVHTGDFKFDMSPVNKQYPDLHRMAEIGNNGVLVLLSESTNAERPGFTPSERLVGEHITEAFSKAEQKVFISTFASNVHRVQQIIEACINTGRKLVLLGRSMANVTTVANELGYLNIPEGLLIEAADTDRFPPGNIAVLCTGSQGEPMAVLSRLASSTHREIEVMPGDTVIIAATAIPGNERNVARIIDNLYLLGANVIYGSGSATGMHVSGHGSQEELKLMLTLMKPKYFIPVHGEFRMLYQHRLLAESVGVDRENIFIINNGDLVEFRGNAAHKTGKIPAGNLLVDGLGIGDIGNIVLRDRKQLSADGILVIVITLSKTEGHILSGPDIISRGFVYVRDSEKLMQDINQLVLTTIDKLKEENISRWSIMKQTLRDSMGRFIFAQTRRRPMILPVIIEV
ncbi:ribonuclease J [Paenibacillus sepulcri]|uniref:Ribonuclease J n=1 Tax=Paenibacillus sepulcri TaxID=359917 RepID=A0ABS7BZ58_9BACL|nr:ribonuclease J [Paenibacillus sepulcri]